MKYSIRRQITAIFIGLLVFILGAVLVVNNGFLGTYYLSHKSQELLRTYNEVDSMFTENKLSETSSLNNILIRTEKANVDLIVIDAGGDERRPDRHRRGRRRGPEHARDCGSPL